jgi:hypothetical protein
MLFIAAIVILFVVFTHKRRSEYAGLPVGAAKPVVPLWLFLALVFGAIYGVCYASGVFN